MIKIVTDSSSNLTPEEAAELGVTVVPLKVIFGDKEYKANVDIGKAEFYIKLKEAKELPTTTQPSTADLQQAMEEGPENEVIGIFLASKLSGTYQGAVIASENVEGKNIHIIDSGTAAIGQRILVQRAVDLKNRGLSASEIVRIIEKEKKEIVLFGVLDTLKYLHKGGRLSGAAALAGSILGVKPVITLREGNLTLAGKERGKVKAYNFLRDTLMGMGPIDKNRPYVLAYTDDRDDLKLFREVLTEEFAPADAPEDIVSSEIGTHTGPGTIGIAYFTKNI